jgi:predicted O-methyltransferase YrrM
MHSPFVFDFILRVLNNGNGYTTPGEIKKLKDQLLHDRRLLQIEDHGAGSRTTSSKQRTVAQLARSAVKPEKYGQMLHRLVRHYKPSNIIELGTSLGVTTAYLSAGNPSSNIITIEGSSAIANVAEENLAKLGISNVKLLRGTFDERLPEVLQEMKTVDLAYVDGNHRYEPTINYFNQILSHCGNGSIIVFDDIHWSREMEQAWAEIRQHPSVRCSLDIFFLGFVFFRKEFREVQHFSIRF